MAWAALAGLSCAGPTTGPPWPGADSTTAASGTATAAGDSLLYYIQVQPPVYNFLKSNKQRKKPFIKKNCLKATSTLLDWFQNASEVNKQINHISLKCLPAHLAPWSKFTDPVMVSLSRSDRRIEVHLLKMPSYFFHFFPKKTWNTALLYPQRENYTYCHGTTSWSLPATQEVVIWLQHYCKFWQPTNLFSGAPTPYSMTFSTLLHCLRSTHLSIFPPHGERKGIASTKLPMRSIKALHGRDLKIHFLQVASITKFGLDVNIWKMRVY